MEANPARLRRSTYSNMNKLRLPRWLSPAFLAIIASLSRSAEGAVDHRLLIGDDSKQRIALVEPGGRISWEHHLRSIHDLSLLPNGNVLFQTNWTTVLEMTPEKRTVWSYDSNSHSGSAGKNVEIHAFQRLPNGLTMIAESGRARIIEVDPHGKIQHEIKLKVEHPSVHSDTRMARKLSNGNYLVCHESDGAVREYDSTGKVVWDFPVPLFGRERKGGHGPEAFGNAVYGALRFPNGNTLVATGNGHSLLEVTPTNEIVWSLHQHELPGIQLAWVTTLSLLPNGNIVFGNCHAGPDYPQIIEITKDKKVIWTFKDFQNFGNSLPVSQVIDPGALIR